MDYRRYTLNYDFNYKIIDTNSSLVTNCYGNIVELTVKYGACAIKMINTAHAHAHCTSDIFFTTNICTGAEAPAQ